MPENTKRRVRRNPVKGTLTSVDVTKNSDGSKTKTKTKNDLGVYRDVKTTSKSADGTKTKSKTKNRLGTAGVVTKTKTKTKSADGTKTKSKSTSKAKKSDVQSMGIYNARSNKYTASGERRLDDKERTKTKTVNKKEGTRSTTSKTTSTGRNYKNSTKSGGIPVFSRSRSVQKSKGNKSVTRGRSNRPT